MPTVIITEKPSAMSKIAHSLSSSPRKVESGRFYWYELSKGKQKIIVTCAVGHLFALDAVKHKGGWSYPVFDVQWVPAYTRKGSEFSKIYLDTLSQAVKKGDDFIVATDFDTEGEVIGYNILKFIVGKTEAKRMKFSSMTKEELVESFENASPSIYINQADAGLTRHYLDFYWGINLTRALTLAIKNSSEKAFAILSTGRVQGPTLAMLHEREMEIRNFKPTPFWQILLHIKLGDMQAVAQYIEEKIWEKENADKILEESKGKDAIVENVDKREYTQSPPVPFNTTDLLTESYNQFKFSPTQTMSLAESLYQAGFISYPRTSSQKLPPNINYVKIIGSLTSLKPYASDARTLLSKGKLIPVEGKREDPAHPAVYPTAEIPRLENLTAQQRKLYDLIVKRFLAAFSDPAIRESNTITLGIDSNKFVIVGKRTVYPGWTKVYSPYVLLDELLLPELNVGDNVKVSEIGQLSKETQPPGRYSQGSILREMENRNLGTKATRAEILKTLYDRGYINSQSIQVTKLGEAVIQALKEFSPKILSEELTKKFEDETEQVSEGKIKREQVVSDAEKILVEILGEFKANEQNIGKKLLEGLQESRKDERRVGNCLNCKTGELNMIFSRKTGKRFVGCTNYKQCGTGFPLPTKGSITALGKACKDCSWPMIRVWVKGRRPYMMCINHKCKSKENWGKGYKTTKPKSQSWQGRKTQIISA
ncbi:DNA topoisomerase I [archaeon]|nr:MAG: DNA topoisomerase I [archaeon]